jgi:hypothetical protein
VLISPTLEFEHELRMPHYAIYARVDLANFIHILQKAWATEKMFNSIFHCVV